MRLPALSARALLLAVLIGAAGGVLTMPRERSSAAEAVPLPDGFHHAVQTVPVEDEEPSEQEAAWAQLAATLKLVKAAEEMVAQAQSLHSIAEAVAEKARAERGAPPADGAQDGATRVALAEAGLAMAGKVLEAAQSHAENARAAFNIAWANVVRTTPNVSRAAPEPDPDPTMVRCGWKRT